MRQPAQVIKMSQAEEIRVIQIQEVTECRIWQKNEKRRWVPTSHALFISMARANETSQRADELRNKACALEERIQAGDQAEGLIYEAKQLEEQADQAEDVALKEAILFRRRVSEAVQKLKSKRGDTNV